MDWKGADVHYAIPLAYHGGHVHGSQINSFVNERHSLM